ncbi:hypothetical protein [uncultured Fusobacterium sp.]|nr:hypothetical protein [uncultured Fusobacterium sp.]
MKVVFFDESYIHCTKLARDNFIPECCWENRKDEKNVIFVEVENND